MKKLKNKEKIILIILITLLIICLLFSKYEFWGCYICGIPIWHFIPVP